MSRTLTPQEAREELDRYYFQLREKYVPSEAPPAKDGEFAEWEQKVDEFQRELMPKLLEILACLSPRASLEEPGHCPHCGSGNTKWLEETKQRERQSKHGKVVLPRQVARCRSCGRSFSPSGAGLGPAGGNAADAPGGRTAGAGDGDSAF